MNKLQVNSTPSYLSSQGKDEPRENNKWSSCSWRKSPVSARSRLEMTVQNETAAGSTTALPHTLCSVRATAVWVSNGSTPRLRAACDCNAGDPAGPGRAGGRPLLYWAQVAVARRAGSLGRRWPCLVGFSLWFNGGEVGGEKGPFFTVRTGPCTARCSVSPGPPGRDISKYPEWKPLERTRKQRQMQRQGLCTDLTVESSFYVCSLGRSMSPSSGPHSQEDGSLSHRANDLLHPTGLLLNKPHTPGFLLDAAKESDFFYATLWPW